MDKPKEKKSIERGIASFIGRKWDKRHADVTEAPALQTVTTANVSERFTQEEAARMADPHAPESFLICCVDSRFQPAKALDYGPGTALEYRPIACVIPPSYKAEPDFKSKMAFRRLKEVDSIIMVCHSDCGGCQAALAVPNPDPNSDDDLHTVASFIHTCGADIPLLAKGFLEIEKGDIRSAGDLLAREVGVKSFYNLLGYKGREGYQTIGDEVKSGALNVMLLFYDLSQRSFDLYDPAEGEWKHTAACDWIGFKAKGAMHRCADESRSVAVSLKKPYDGWLK